MSIYHSTSERELQKKHRHSRRCFFLSHVMIFFYFSHLLTTFAWSDHTVRGTLNLNIKMERSRLMKSRLRPTATHIQNPESFQLELLSVGQRQPTRLKTACGNIVTSKTEILRDVEKFYVHKVVYIQLETPITCALALPYDNEYGPDYGEEWLLFDDYKGETHTLNFSTIPNETRALILGDAYYYLYTRRNFEPELLEVPEDNEPFKSQYFNCSNDIKVITHGWVSCEQNDWLQNIKDAFLRKYDYNVITIDWNELAKNPVYPLSAFSTRYVGKKTAKLLDACARSYKTDSRHVHLIGHSLGAHVMGYTGHFSNTRINRITGLDPARPLFELPLMPLEYRLDKNDADFVDIIHTCGGLYGYKDSHGHADFYPNDGRAKQPGCEGTQQVIEGCSHGRSTHLFAESIDSEVPFVAYQCDSWKKFENGECKENYTMMGYPTQSYIRGDFYLYTNSQPKYAICDKNI